MEYTRTQEYVSHSVRPQCNPGHVYLWVGSARLSRIVRLHGLWSASAIVVWSFVVLHCLLLCGVVGCVVV